MSPLDTFMAIFGEFRKKLVSGKNRLIKLFLTLGKVHTYTHTNIHTYPLYHLLLNESVHRIINVLPFFIPFVLI